MLRYVVDLMLTVVFVALCRWSDVNCCIFVFVALCRGSDINCWICCVVSWV